jgi:nucleotide-binding universal stress UspA family protein
MFEKILLPLDGSQTAEIAIPYALEMAGRLNANLSILHVEGPQHVQFHHMHEVYISGMVESIEKEIKRRWRGSTVKVKGEILAGDDPAHIVYDYVIDNDIGLVVMATHGGSGFKSWILGSVTNKLVRALWSPTLVIRAGGSETIKQKGKLFDRILLPLGTSEGSRTAIPFAEELAVKLKLKVSLYRMARSNYSYAGMEGMVYPVGINFTRIDRNEEQRSWSYLNSIAKKMREKDIPVTYSAELGNDPAYGIIEAATKVKADMILMSTHGNSKLAKWVFGSITEKVLNQTNLPLLLVRKPEE